MIAQLANVITMTRIVGAISLISTETFSKAFFAIYTYCGISDALDGFVARKTKSTSKLGSMLDSVADLVFYAVMLGKIWITLIDYLPAFFVKGIFTVFGIRSACYLYVFVKDGKLASEHFILNKVTGLLLFFVPYLLFTKVFVYYAAIVILVSFVAAIAEFKYHLSNSPKEVK